MIRLEREGSFGYADIHPWEELGDEPLESHLKSFSSVLAQRALYFAEMDRQARELGCNLLSDVEMPVGQPHASLQENYVSGQGSSHLKIKLGMNPSREIAWLQQLTPLFIKDNIKLRLDFNNRLDQKSFHSYLESIKPLHTLIDFIEDPYPFNDKEWASDQKKFPFSLALDFGSERGLGKIECARVLILKPVRQCEAPFFEAKAFGQRVVTTSAFDHPVGQIAAAWVACKLPDEVTGLLTHRYYPPNSFSAEIDQEGFRLKKPRGTGFGFDHLLEKLEWKDG